MPDHKNDWAAATARIAIKLITTGNIAWLAFMVIVLAGIWRLDSADLRLIVLGFIGWPWFAVTGWGLFLFTLFLSSWIFRAQRQLSKNEIDRMATVRDKAVQMNLELEMKSSNKS